MNKVKSTLLRSSGTRKMLTKVLNMVRYCTDLRFAISNLRFENHGIRSKSRVEISLLLLLLGVGSRCGGLRGGCFLGGFLLLSAAGGWFSGDELLLGLWELERRPFDILSCPTGIGDLLMG